MPSNTKYIVLVLSWITPFSFSRTPTSAIHTGQEPMSVLSTCMQPSLHTFLLFPPLPPLHFLSFSFSPVSYPLISKVCVRNSMTAKNRITNYWHISAGWHLRHQSYPSLHSLYALKDFSSSMIFQSFIISLKNILDTLSYTKFPETVFLVNFLYPYESYPAPLFST